MPTAVCHQQPVHSRQVTPLAQVWMIVVSLAPGLPDAVGVARFRRIPVGGRLLVGWLSISLVLNLFMMTFSMRGIRNSTIAHLSLPVFCTMGLLTLAVLADDQRYRNAARVVGALYLLVWGVVSLENGIRADYSAYAQPLMNLVLTGAAASLIVVRLGQIGSRPLKDSTLLIGLGALVTYAPSVAIDPVAAVISNSDLDLAIKLYFVRALFLIVGAILYTLALLWIPPHRSSSGS